MLPGQGYLHIAWTASERRILTLFSEQFVVALDEMGDEVGDCLGALTQRRNGDRRRAHPIIEVFAKLALLHHCAQVAIGRRDQPQIHFEYVRGADRLDFTILDRAQQFGLQVQGQLADLVEKQRPAISGTEIAERIFARVGIGALDVTEQLGFGQ